MMLKNYFITTFRNLIRNKVNSFINITGLTISIACCIVIYVFIRHEKTFDHYHKKSDRIYRIVSDNRTTNGVSYHGYVTFALAPALRNDFPNLETVTQVYINNQATISIEDSTGSRKVFEEKEMTFADESFLKTFDHKVLAGQQNDLLSTPGQVVLTKQLAEKFYGVRNASGFEALIGKTITVNKETCRISAILDDVARNSNVTFRMLLPFSSFARNNSGLINNWKNTFSESYVFVTLPTDYSAKKFDAALVAFKNKYLEPEVVQNQSYHPQALKEVHTDTRYGGTLYATPDILVVAFICMGIIVLLTSCINFINLATAQSLKRAKEVGIRKSLGGRGSQIILQFMTETFLLVLVAALVAVFLSGHFLKMFNDYLSFVVDLGLHIDSTIIYFLAGLTILISLLAGYYPARLMAAHNPVKVLKTNLAARNPGSHRSLSLRKVLVVTQFAVSQLLIIGTIVVASQMKYFYSSDLGFLKEGILTVEIPENNPQKFALFRNSLMNLSQVKGVTFNSGPPTSASNSFGEMRRKDAPQQEKFGMERKFVDPFYIPAYNIQLIAGRNLQESDKTSLAEPGDQYNVVLNKKAVARLGFATAAEAINKTIIVNEKDQATIVGITEDFYNVSLQKNIEPCLLFYSTNWVAMAGIRLNPGAEKIHPIIKQKWEQVFPGYSYKAMSLTDYFKYKAFYILEDVMYQGFKIFLILSIIVGCLGLYGLVSFLAVQRQKEIGIRKVLGASVPGIVYLFSREFVILVLVAFLVAAPFGYIVMHYWLQMFANRINITPAYFVAAFLLSMLVAALTVSFKAFGAAVANPVKSLRTE